MYIYMSVCISLKAISRETYICHPKRGQVRYRKYRIIRRERIEFHERVRVVYSRLCFSYRCRVKAKKNRPSLSKVFTNIQKIYSGLTVKRINVRFLANNVLWLHTVPINHSSTLRFSRLSYA